MREVAPGDLVFSYADTLIKAIGIGISSCYDCPKPPEFGTAGKVWGRAGWRVDVRWLELKNRIKPGSHHYPIVSTGGQSTPGVTQRLSGARPAQPSNFLHRQSGR